MPKQISYPTPGTFTRKYNLKERVYHYWLVSRWLSLDVAAGAMVCCLMACKLLGVSPLPWDAAAVLAGTVLTIYMLDHVLDVWHSGGKVFSPRREFHWRYRKHLLGACLCLMCLMAATVLVFLPLPVIVFGIILASLVIAYLWLVSKLGTRRGKHWFHKELLIACLYTAGVWGVAFMYSNYLQQTNLYLVLAFLLIALQNLLLFSYFEQEEDRQQGQRSMVMNLGAQNVKILLSLVFALSALVLLFAWYTHTTLLEKQVFFTEAGMSGILFMLFIFPGCFTRHRRYRWLGDGVFLLPAWLLF